MRTFIAVLLVLIVATVAIGQDWFIDKLPAPTPEHPRGFLNFRKRGCSAVPGTCACPGPHWTPVPGTTRHVLTAAQKATMAADNEEGARKNRVSALRTLDAQVAALEHLLAACGRAPKLAARVQARLTAKTAARNAEIAAIEATLP